MRFSLRYLPLCVGILLVLALPARAQVILTIDGASARVGQTLRIPVRVAGLDGQDITSYQIKLTYAADVLAITAIETAGGVAAGLAPAVNLSTPGLVQVAGAGTVPIAGSGVLFEIVAEVTGADLLGERIFTPRFDEALFFTSQSIPVGVSTTSGAFSVRGIELAVEALTSAAGAPFSTPITICDLAGFGVTAYQFSLRYDASAVSVTSISAAGSLSEGGSITQNPAAGEVRIAYAGSRAMTGGGDLLYIQGQRLSSADPGWELVAVRFFDADGQFVPVGPAGFEARLPVVAGATGSRVTLDVPFGDADGLGLVAYQFTIAYDPNVLSLINTSEAGTLSAGRTVTSKPGTGRLSAAWAGATPLEGEGPLVGLVADIRSSGDAEMRYEDYKLVGSAASGGGGGGGGVTGGPDLIVESLNVTPGSVRAGDVVQVDLTIRNNGDAPALPFKTNIRLNTSTTGVVDTDPLLETCALDGLAAGASTTACSREVTLPADLASGTYSVWVILDFESKAGQVDEENDVAFTSVFVEAKFNTAGFLTLPFERIADVEITHAWYYSDDCVLHAPKGAIDYDAVAPGHTETFKILAATDGEVFYRGFHPPPRNYGNLLILKHVLPNGEVYFSMYAHLKTLPELTTGSTVEQGEPIAEAGATGDPSYAVHLHFEIRKQDPQHIEIQGSLPNASTPIDPYDIYRKKDGVGCNTNEMQRNAYPDPVTGASGGMGANHLWLTDPPSYPPLNTSIQRDFHEESRTAELFAPFPNPTSQATVVSFQFQSHRHAHITVSDLLGRQLITLLNADMSPGRHEVTFDAGALPSGTYVVELRTDEGVLRRLVTVVR